ncbi:MAG: hypothetical protein ACLP2Y_01800 [Limisphaerales bacterium]
MPIEIHTSVSSSSASFTGRAARGGTSLPHPVTSATVTIAAPWPKDLKVAVKYLRQFAK